jgi:hypothetical protein
LIKDTSAAQIARAAELNSAAPPVVSVSETGADPTAAATAAAAAVAAAAADASATYLRYYTDNEWRAATVVPDSRVIQAFTEGQINLAAAAAASASSVEEAADVSQPAQ